MDQKEIAARISALESELSALKLARSSGDVSGVSAPDGWVRVWSPYPRGAKSRDYPDPARIMNYEGKPVATITGYANQVQENWNCSHFDYRSQGGRLMQLGDRLDAVLAKEGSSAYPKVLDEMAFPDDYVDPATAKPPSADDKWVSDR